MRAAAAALMLVGAVAAPAPALAASPALEDARKLTSKASIEYDVGHFEEALELYTRAYERYPKPALLFDIGQCHRLLGHHERAVFFFQGYLRGQPAAPNRQLVEKLIAESQQEPAAPPAAGDTSGKSGAPPAAPPAAPQVPPAADITPRKIGAPPEDDPGPVATATPSPVLRIAGIATAGVGVVLLGTAVFEGLHASSLSGDVAQVSASHGAWTPQAQSDYDSGKSAATAADVLYVAGAVALAAGAVMTWFGWPRTRATTAAVAPSPGGASVALVTRF